MPLYSVSPEISGFSCEAGSATAREDGLFEFENPDILAAMAGHGLTVTEVAEPKKKPGRPKKEDASEEQAAEPTA